MIYAYLRVSTDRQNIKNQKHEIIKFSEQRNFVIDKWEVEIVSGIKSERIRSLGGLIEKMCLDDTLIISELSRLSRSFWGILNVLNQCANKGINIFSVKEDFQFTDNLNSKVVSFAFSLCAEIERNLISSRTKEALDRKKAEGIKLGRPVGTSHKKNKLDEHWEEIEELRKQGVKYEQIALKFDVSRTTLFNFLKEKRIDTR